MTTAVVSALGHFVPKYQPVMKSRRANLAECSPQPLSDGGNAKGRNEERKDEEHNAAHRLPTNEQDQGEQRQHNAAQLTHGGCHAEQECDHSGQQGQRHHHGGGKDFENDHSSYLHQKIGLVSPSTHIIPLGK